MHLKKQTLTVLLGILLTAAASAKNIRATEWGANVWSELSKKARAELTVEFRQGDELPVSFTSEGDFLETSQAGVSYVKVKRDFWLKIVGDNVQMSLDGANYKPIHDTIKGSFNAGTTPVQGAANAINLVLSAYLK